MLDDPPKSGTPASRYVDSIGNTPVRQVFFQCFTMLWQEPGIQALQVLNQEKKWINAPPIPGTLVMKCVPQIWNLPVVMGLICGGTVLGTNSQDGRVRHRKFPSEVGCWSAVLKDRVVCQMTCSNPLYTEPLTAAVSSGTPCLCSLVRTTMWS